MIKEIIKRDSTKESFLEEKVYKVIEKTFKANSIEDRELFVSITNNVLDKLESEGKDITSVEHVQDVVRVMIARAGYYDVAKSFSIVRAKRERERKKRLKIYRQIGSITKTTDRENANVGNGPSSKLLQIAEVASREFAELELIDEEVLATIRDNKLYPHDLSWLSVGTTTCLFIPFGRLLMDGFNPGHGTIRRPKRIKTASQLFCIIFQSNQNDQHGGQASGWFERDLAPFVTKEYEYQLNALKTTLDKLGVTGYKKDEISKLAWEKTEQETYQAMEGIIFNLNTMHSRAGAQVPFTSINIGTGTSREERMLIKNILLAYERGLGKGEQPFFPNIVFKVKDGVNYESGTPNHDMLKLAMKVSAKRYFPTYDFQDCTLNKDFPEDVPGMGCRTTVRYDRHAIDGRQTCEGRGNLSFTTVNTVGIALEVKYGKGQDHSVSEGEFSSIVGKYGISVPALYSQNTLVQKYFVLLNSYIDNAVKQLLARFKYQSSFSASDFPFLMSGNWMGSEHLKPSDKIGEVLKHGTLGIGFIGIAETLKCLVGKHHGEDENARKLGLEIVKFMDAKAKEASELYDLNFSVIATPAEGLTGKLLSRDREIYGIIQGVTDKDWYTNSSHVPVEYSLSLFEKIRIEGLFTKYCGGGSITYVELSESPEGNTDAIYAIIQAMHDNDVVVGALNYPSDRCLGCTNTGIIEGDTCPVCGGRNISRIRRITGYLAEISNFNHAKRQEALHRVKHQ